MSAVDMGLQSIFIFHDLAQGCILWHVVDILASENNIHGNM
jgi:hypothetical protein